MFTLMVDSLCGVRVQELGLRAAQKCAMDESFENIRPWHRLPHAYCAPKVHNRTWDCEQPDYIFALIVCTECG
jgi:hypothetical protein